MKFFKYCLPALLWPVMNGLAQSPRQAIQPLSISSPMPALTFTRLYNSPTASLSLKDFAGKIIILDFWATWCGSCMEAIPKMQVLQQALPKELKVIMVNEWQDMDGSKLRSFFEKRKVRTGMGMDLVSIFQDTILEQYFPHKSIPHCVWIDAQGRVSAITSPEEITAANIKKMLAGSGGPATTKNDALLFDLKYPLLAGTNGNPAAFLYRSVLTGPMENLGAAGGIVEDDSGRVTRYYDINMHLAGLYQTAYPDVFRFGDKRIFMEAPLNFSALYCYELITPPITKTELQRCLQQDLYRNFHVIAKTELRDISCYTATANNNLEKFYSTHSRDTSDLNNTSLKKFMNHTSIGAVLQQIGSYLDKPIFNETGVTRFLDIDMPAEIYDYNSAQLRAWFYRKAITITETTKKLEVGVLTTDTTSSVPATIFNHP